MIVCWAAKGGSGTTVVACALALVAGGHEPTTLIDLAGDAPTALGVQQPTTPGIAEWLASPTASTADLDRLSTPIRGEARLVHLGAAPLPADQWTRLAAALAARTGRIVVDAGTGSPPGPLHDGASQSLLVIRPCYLALRRAQAMPCAPTGIVLVNEPGRALGAREVEHALGVGVIAEVQFDPAVARAVDAGLLATRIPASLARSLKATPS
jgi:hypothetical protein